MSLDGRTALRSILAYGAHRILLAVPTLMGIILVTFALIHLAPGDPLAGSSGEFSSGSVSERASTRRIFFLDLPLFYNSDPRGIEVRVEGLLADLASSREERVTAAQKGIRHCGTACLGLLAQDRTRLSLKIRDRLDRALAEIRADHPHLASGETTLAQWLEQSRSQISPHAISQQVELLGHDPAAVARTQVLGSAALPRVMETIFAGVAPAQGAASEVASHLTGINGQLSGDATLDAERLERWSEWWYLYKRDYAQFSAGERLWGRLFETRFAKWMGRILTLDFGTSSYNSRPVMEMLLEALPITLLLSFLSLALAYAVAVPLGVHAALRQGSRLERIITLILFCLYSLPSFWVAMLLILLLGGVGYLDWFPIYGLSDPALEDATGWVWLGDRIHHLVLPVICLSYGSLAALSRYQRSAMLEVIRQDYIRTARAKGLSERAVVFKHALRNALLPIITLLGLQLPYLIGGSVIIEKIFNIPGMGLMTFQAFLHRDQPVIMAVAVLSAGLTLLGLILADLCYAVADPRIALEGRR